ncbi:MAG: Ig-like domain-containing protein, partial [Myxococcota bacterium]
MGLGSALVVIALAGAAYGQEPLPGGLVQLVPPAPVTGGAGQVDLYLVALNPDGSPATGLSLKADRAVGMATRWIEVGGGLYKLPYDPPVVEAPSLVTASARGKLASRDKVSALSTFQVVPAPPPFAAEVSPRSLVLGRDAGSALSFDAGPEGVEVRSTVGAVEGLARQPDGEWTARFVPPKLKYPHVALVVWASSADPLRSAGHAVIGLTGNADYPVKGPPGATVSLEVGGRTFGPTTLGADGKGKIPLEAPPGVTVGTQITTVAGQESREELDLKVPETRRIALYPLPGSIAADPARAIPLRVVVVMPNGAPDENARPTFTVPSGSVSEVTHRGEGVYEATWHPGGALGVGQVKASLGSEVQTDVIPVVGVAPRATVTLSASPAAIAPETTAVEVTARLTDPAGGPVTGATVRLDVTGGQLSAPATDAGGGEYRATVVPGPGALELRAHPLAAPSTEPVREVRVSSSAGAVVNDGATEVEVWVTTVDAQGAPVGEVPVALVLVQGDGVLAERELVTGPDGAARTRYTAGTSP